MIDQGRGSNSLWAEGFRASWVEGWPDAIEAMRKALRDSGIDESSYQWDVVENLNHP